MNNCRSYEFFRVEAIYRARVPKIKSSEVRHDALNIRLQALEIQLSILCPDSHYGTTKKLSSQWFYSTLSIQHYAFHYCQIFFSFPNHLRFNNVPRQQNRRGLDEAIDNDQQNIQCSICNSAVVLKPLSIEAGVSREPQYVVS